MPSRDTSPGEPLQQFWPNHAQCRMEGIAISRDGKTLAAVAADNNSLFIHRREKNGLFNTQASQIIDGNSGALKYPHDVAFSPDASGQWLAIAQRRKGIQLFRRSGLNYRYELGFNIPRAGIARRFSDAVSFVPPDGRFLAVCSLTSHRVSFYDTHVLFDTKGKKARPGMVLKNHGIYQPDGLAFSPCGNWLAIANHGKNTVSIFKRNQSPGDSISFDLQPMTIDDESLICPHSVDFVNQGRHLLVTNAGANYFTIYPVFFKPTTGDKPAWSQQAALQVRLRGDHNFIRENACNNKEGGPKGIATNGDTIAVCSPEIGIRIYSFKTLTKNNIFSSYTHDEV